ncbi:hypothetical protein N9934_00165 [Desulfosarcina sp.]|nr:hypothetical protein [Desulfosarcina sp.]
MINYLKQEEIDREKWDQCIDNAFNGMTYAKSWYLDLVTEQWDALVENDYESVFPLVYRKKYGIFYLYQPVFTQQLGIFSTSLLTEDTVSDFIDSIPKHFRFAEINLNTFNKVQEGKYKVLNWLNHELDLIKPYDLIHKNYSTNLKRNLKKAEKEKLTFVENIKPDDIIKIFRENRGLNVSLNEEDYIKLNRLAYAGIYRGVIKTYGVYTTNNEICAGVIFMQSKKKKIFLFSGLTEQGKQLNAMPFLIDQFIQQNNQHHITLDFEGSNDPNLARFYKSFGSKEITYPHLKINHFSFPFNIIFRVIKGI